MTIVDKLKKYREELSIKRGNKVTQAQLAKELGVSRGNIGDIENGSRKPSKSILIKLADHSGKSLEYWLEGFEEYEPPNTVDLALDKMIEDGLITDANTISNEVWEIIKEAVLLEIQRKLDKNKGWLFWIKFVYI